jgi:ferrous iron transport protein B
MNARLVALVGNPNCGKTALFNRLTGSHQKVANYAGVTIERKEGRFTTPEGRRLRLLDLPGTYSLSPHSLDEQVSCDVLHGKVAEIGRPDAVICVVDATNLRRNLRLVLAVKRLGLPLVVAVNMMDMAKRQGLHIDLAKLSARLNVPVVATVATRAHGASELAAVFDQNESWQAGEIGATQSTSDDHKQVQTILKELQLDHVLPSALSDRIDRVVMNPIMGPLILLAVLFFIFQAVFSWAEWPMSLIEDAAAFTGAWLQTLLPDNLLRSLLVDGLIAGLGGVIVFLPQIIILFFFILVLEESGYLPRAAFLLDRLMGGVGLSGRSFIPLLSSFACAIPGIMATRTIQNDRDRWVTIMIAPLMTCSARLPVYALLIAAFIPAREVLGGLSLQGLVLFALYGGGIVAALGVAWVMKRFTAKNEVRQLMMELPTYHLPAWRNIAIGLAQRVQIFLTRVGGIILALTIILWFLSTFPAAPDNATAAAIEYSYAGQIGRVLAVVFEPIGFNWQIAIALVPGLAAREVAVSALGTVYALSATDDSAGQLLAPLIAAQWSLATALSLLVWYVFAPQCLATLATVKRETGRWRDALFMAAYLFALAYLASFITYRVALWLGV